MPKYPWTMIVAAPLFAGCGIFGSIDEDNYKDKYAEQICKITEECNRIVFDGLYDGDMAECMDAQNDYWDEVEDLSDGCDFDDGAAEDCINSLKEAECGDFYDADDNADIFEDCGKIWDCG